MAKPQLEDGYTRIANEIMEALIRMKMSGQELRTTLLVIRKTYGYRKKEDYISLSQIAQFLKTSKVRCSQIINKLQARGILTVKENINGLIKKYIFNKDFEQWRTVNKKLNRIEKTKEPLRKNLTLPLIKNLTTKENNTKENNTKETISLLFQKSDIKEFIDFYFKSYREKFKVDPPFKGGRDGKTVKTLLKVMTVDILKTTVSRYLETEDLFFKKNGYDIPRFEKFLDGLKCGAFGNEESRPQSVSKSQRNSIEEEYTGPLDVAGNPLEVIK